MVVVASPEAIRRYRVTSGIAGLLRRRFVRMRDPSQCGIHVDGRTRRLDVLARRRHASVGWVAAGESLAEEHRELIAAALGERPCSPWARRSATGISSRLQRGDVEGDGSYSTLWSVAASVAASKRGSPTSTSQRSPRGRTDRSAHRARGPWRIQGSGRGASLSCAEECRLSLWSTTCRDWLNLPGLAGAWHR